MQLLLRFKLKYELDRRIRLIFVVASWLSTNLGWQLRGSIGESNPYLDNKRLRLCPLILDIYGGLALNGSIDILRFVLKETKKR